MVLLLIKQTRNLSIYFNYPWSPLLKELVDMVGDLLELNLGLVC